MPDHAITIVGWDDEYKKENFQEENRPTHDGAYIILNSWGEEVGDYGYFYVSYDDTYIEQDISGVKELTEITENTETYDKIYEYDELGMTTYLLGVNDAQTQLLDTIYAANVFERENSSDKYEYLLSFISE